MAEPQKLTTPQPVPPRPQPGQTVHSVQAQQDGGGVAGGRGNARRAGSGTTVDPTRRHQHIYTHSLKKGESNLQMK